MPYYEYTCTPCHITTMTTRKVDDRDLPISCTSCNSDMNRTYTSPAISFKGSGFYSTDKNK